MMIDLFPYVYSELLRPTDLFTRTVEIADQNGLQLKSESKRIFEAISQAVIEDVEKSFWSEESRKNMRERGQLPLSEFKTVLLTKPVPLTVYEFSDTVQSIVLKVEAALGNDFPVLGVDVWLRDEMQLFGGLITVTSKDDEAATWRARSLAKDIRGALGVTLRSEK